MFKHGIFRNTFWLYKQVACKLLPPDQDDLWSLIREENDCIFSQEEENDGLSNYASPRTHVQMRLCDAYYALPGLCTGARPLPTWPWKARGWHFMSFLISKNNNSVVLFLLCSSLNDALLKISCSRSENNFASPASHHANTPSDRK
jgi:hypothetical protein